MTGESTASGADSSDEDELFRRLADMLAADLEPPATVTELAKQTFGLRTVDAELAALTADSWVEGTAAAVRRSTPASAPRLLSFTAGDLLVEVEITTAGPGHRLLGELVPAVPATVEVRQPQGAGPRRVETDEDGRFLIDGLRTGPFSLTCRRPGHPPVTTEWTRIE